MTNYYSILRQAVSTLDSNTAAARTSLYERARRMLAAEFSKRVPPLSEQEKVAEKAGFDAAIARIEGEFAQRNAGTPRAGPSTRETAPQVRSSNRQQDARPPKKYTPSVLLSVVAIIAALAIGAAAYLYVTANPASVTRADNSPDRSEPNRRVGTRGAEALMDTEELAPGVDGGSTDSGLPYYFRRQPVYYRTVYAVGTIVIDRSQRFLYLVQPKIVALRYGIGIGGECRFEAGLHRITRKEEWPEWIPAADLIRRRNYPARMAGMPGNPMGARALYFDGNGIGIHGTNTPKAIGHAISLGCFRMVNDDVVDLYRRVSTETTVVIVN